MSRNEIHTETRHILTDVSMLRPPVGSLTVFLFSLGEIRNDTVLKSRSGVNCVGVCIANFDLTESSHYPHGRELS